MKILEYADFPPPRNKAQYDKVRQAIERDDFRSADVKKLTNLAHGKFYRAKLDYADRLLFSTIRYQGEVYALMLEVIEQHAYGKSRFLRGANIDDDKIRQRRRPMRLRTPNRYAICIRSAGIFNGSTR